MVKCMASTLNTTGFQFLDTVKICGIHFGSNAVQCNEQLLEGKIDKAIAHYTECTSTLFSRVSIANTVLLAQLWYVLSVVNVSSPFLKRINRKIFLFVWKSNEWLKRTESINNLNDGGLGVLDIQSRISAFRIKEIIYFILHSHCLESIVAQHWLALPLKKWFDTSDFILSPKRSRVNAYYKGSVSEFRDFHARWGHRPLDEATIKLIYADRLGKRVTTPKIFLRELQPKGVDGNTLFTRLHGSLISNEVRDLWFRIIHQILNTRLRLHNFRIINTMICPLCRYNVESEQHLFFDCPKISNVKTILDKLLTISNVDIYTVNLGKIFEGVDAQYNSIVLGEFMYSVWLVRNAIVFRQETLQLQNIFFSRLKTRIRADKKRLLIDVFRSIWFNKPIIIANTSRGMQIDIPIT